MHHSPLPQAKDVLLPVMVVSAVYQALKALADKAQRVRCWLGPGPHGLEATMSDRSSALTVAKLTRFYLTRSS